MAVPRKRLVRPRGDDANPNKVLVVFLVLFILTTLGAGAFGWLQMNEKDKEVGKAKKDKDAATTAKKGEEWAQLMGLEARAAAGDPALKETNSPDLARWKDLRSKVVDYNAKDLTFLDGEFKDEKELSTLTEMIKKHVKDLEWDPKGERYKNTYRGFYLEQKKQLDEMGKAREKLEADLRASEAELKRLQDTIKANHDALMKAIKDGNDAALKKAGTLTEQMEAMQKQVQELQDDKDRMKTAHEKVVDGLERKLRVANDELKQAIKTIKAIQGGTATGTAGGRPAIDPHALVLDISKGKPLWDAPRGKVVRVDENHRTIHLDRGSADGVKPGLTFNIFAASWDNKAEGPLKGTIEVVRTLPDGKSAVAQVTALYDADGQEIALNDPNPRRVQREAANAIKEGDLLFNLAWGTRVAVAGIIDWGSANISSPAGQVDALGQFLRTLEAQGVAVDAFIDLRDGKVVGAITPQTHYLIVGFRPHVEAGKEPVGRDKDIIVSMTALRRDAIEKGLFLISVENFATVIGYRRPRSATNLEISAFRPGQPRGGSGLVDLDVGEGGKGPAKKGPEKKGPEKKN